MARLLLAATESIDVWACKVFIVAIGLAQLDIRPVVVVKLAGLGLAELGRRRLRNEKALRCERGHAGPDELSVAVQMADG